MAEITPEELERRVKLTKELLELEGQLTEKQRQQVVEGKAIVDRAQQILDTGNRRLEQLEIERTQLTEKDTDELAINAKRIEEQKVFAQFAREHQNEIIKVQDGLKKHAQTAREESEKSYKDANKNLHKLQDTSIKTIDTFSEVIDVIPAGVEAAASSAVGGLTAATLDPAMIAAMGGPHLKRTFEDFKSTSIKAIGDVDTQLRQTVKNQGGYYEELQGTFIATMDPNYARRMGVSFEGIPDLVHSAGYAAEDVQLQMTALLDKTAMFRPAFAEQETAAASFMVNTGVGLSKLGVTQDNSAKILNTYTKVLKQSPVDATKSLKGLVTIGKDLGISANRVTSDFVGSVDSIAEWGPEMTRVFADLEAQSIGTSVATDKMLAATGKMDTFKGAAEAAGKLNAVLGDTYISATDLAMADPAEKMNMIRDAVARSGVDFESADRWMKRIISNAAGFDSVADASKMLLNKEEAEAAAGALSDKVMTQEELTKEINATMTSAQQITKSLSNLAGAQKEFLDIARPGAVSFANIVTNAFGEVLGATENNLAALALFHGALYGTETLAKGFLGSLKDITGAAEGLTPDWLENMAKVLAGGAVALAVTPEIMSEAEGAWKSPGPKGVETGGAPAGTAIMNKMSEWTTSMRDLTDALNNQSDVPINLNVETTMDKEAVGKGAAEFTINLITNEVQGRGGP